MNWNMLLFLFSCWFFFLFCTFYSICMPLVILSKYFITHFHFHWINISVFFLNALMEKIIRRWWDCKSYFFIYGEMEFFFVISNIEFWMELMNRSELQPETKPIVSNFWINEKSFLHFESDGLERLHKLAYSILNNPSNNSVNNLKLYCLSFWSEAILHKELPLSTRLFFDSSYNLKPLIYVVFGRFSLENIYWVEHWLFFARGLLQLLS